MRNMFFLDDLYEYLLETGEIYTVRKFCYHRGVDIIHVNHGGRFKRSFIKEVTATKDLEEYASRGGLGTAKEWATLLLQLNDNHPPTSVSPFYMYRVIKL